MSPREVTKRANSLARAYREWLRQVAVTEGGPSPADCEMALRAAYMAGRRDAKREARKAGPR